MSAPIEKCVRAVRRRLRALRFYHAAPWGFSIATALAALVFLAGKIYPLPLKPDALWLLWAGLTLVGFGAAAGYAILSRLTLLEAAQAADLRLCLAERLSSALALRSREADPGVAALLEDAALTARRVRPREHFPLEFRPRTVHHLWPCAALLAIHFFVPAFNWFQPPPTANNNAIVPADRAAEQQEAERIEKLAKSVVDSAASDHGQDLAKYAKDLEKLAQDLKTGELDRRQAMAEMSRLSEEVRVDRQSLAKQFEALQRSTPMLQSAFSRDLQRNLQNNDFEKAEASLKEMAAKMAANPEGMSAAEQERMAQDLQDMARQMQASNPQMAQAMQQAAQALQQCAACQKAGDSAQSQAAQAQAQAAAAQAQQALQQLAESMANQAEAAEMMRQLDQLQQSLESQKREMARNMGLCDKPGSCQGGQQGQREGQRGQGQGQGSGEGGGERSTDQGMGNREGRGSGQWREGYTETQGSGMGGPGRGRGGEIQYDDSVNPRFEDTRPPGVANAGEIIAVMNVEGAAEKGDSKIEYQQVFTEYRQKADDAIQRETIPAGYRTMVRDYFDSISPESFEQKK